MGPVSRDAKFIACRMQEPSLLSQREMLVKIRHLASGGIAAAPNRETILQTFAAALLSMTTRFDMVPGRV